MKEHLAPLSAERPGVSGYLWGLTKQQWIGEVWCWLRITLRRKNHTSAKWRVRTPSPSPSFADPTAAAGALELHGVIITFSPPVFHIFLKEMHVRYRRECCWVASAQQSITGSVSLFEGCWVLDLTQPFSHIHYIVVGQQTFNQPWHVCQLCTSNQMFRQDARDAQWQLDDTGVCLICQCSTSGGCLGHCCCCYCFLKRLEISGIGVQLFSEFQQEASKS